MAEKNNIKRITLPEKKADFEINAVNKVSAINNP